MTDVVKKLKEKEAAVNGVERITDGNILPYHLRNKLEKDLQYIIGYNLERILDYEDLPPDKDERKKYFQEVEQMFFKYCPLDDTDYLYNYLNLCFELNTREKLGCFDYDKGVRLLVICGKWLDYLQYHFMRYEDFYGEEKAKKYRNKIYYEMMNKTEKLIEEGVIGGFELC